MTAEHTVVTAWTDARSNRSIESGFLLHSYRGIQYTCTRFLAILSLNTYIDQSMSRKGNCWDNAVAESLFKIIKYEELNHHAFTCYEQLYECIEEYVRWYKTTRIHSNLDYQTPLEREIEIRTQHTKTAA